ncbi:MAG: SIS domain-containing protein [Trueperaceae bacterium]|nr:SIS domain-containing protein [Trueperaceae bacterium]
MTHFEQEIREQPAVLRHILQDAAIKEVAEKLKTEDISLILTLARGSSDNAVTFFVYLAGQYLGLPVASLPPSLFSVYASTMKLGSALVVGVSQSGESSDVVKGLELLTGAGAKSLAISNNAQSSLAKIASYHLEQNAGHEQAVAASKTFLSQMMVMACLVAHWSGSRDLQLALEKVPEALQTIIDHQEGIERAALRLTHAESAYILGRGLSYGPSQELALKLKETSYLHAQAYSSAEFQHGPIAAVDATDPIILLGLDDGTLESNILVAQRLRDLDADLTILSSNLKLLAFANAEIKLPAGHGATQAFEQILCGQLLALHLTQSKRLDPDQPRNLKKVTQTM